MATTAQQLHRHPLPPAALRVEHVTMETVAEGLISTDAPPRVALRTCAIEGPFRQPGGEMAILDGHYLGVRTVSRQQRALEYQVDLRFARPGPVRIHCIPSGWIGGAVFLAVVGAFALAYAVSHGLGGSVAYVVGGLTAVAASVAAGYAAVCSATTLVEIRSVQGDAPIARVCGQAGRARLDSEFVDELAGHIEAARRARPQDRHQFLCDLMREHYRLRSLGVLAEDEYEASKARILAAH